MIHLVGLGHAVITVGVTRLTQASETLFASALLFVREAGKPIERHRIIELLWPRASVQRANHRLRQTLYRLNTLGAALRSDRGHITLPARSAQSDFGEVLAAGRSADPHRVAELVQGPFLPGYAPRFSPSFSEWLERERDVVTSGLRRVLVAAIGTQRERNDWAAVERLATRCLLLDPLNEEATLALAEAAAFHGSKVRALEILDSYLRELGPAAGDIRVPATLLRRRIAEAYRAAPEQQRASQLGRDQEMQDMKRVLHGLFAAHGETCLVCGEEGIGKTRFAAEVACAAQLDGIKVVRLEREAHDVERPLAGIIEVVRRLRAMRGAIAVAEGSKRTLDAVLIATEPAAGPELVDTDQLGARLRVALIDLLDAVSHEQPVVLIIEDAQWLDRASWTCVRAVSRWAIKHRALVVLTARQSDTAQQFDCADDVRPRLVRLKPLDEPASRALVQRIVSGSARDGNEPFTEWCVARGGGNPYVLTELAVRAEGESEPFRAPTALERIASERLDGLGDLQLRMLQAIAVLGSASSTRRVEELLGATRLGLLNGFDTLSTAGMIGLEGDRIVLRHRLTADAALERLSEPARQLLHRRAAELLERERSSEVPDALAGECAEHWQYAGEHTRAVELLTGAASRLTGLGMPIEAARFYERAAQITTSAPDKLHHLAARAHALFLGAEWEPFVHVATELESLQRHTRSSPDNHDDTELELSLAKWRLGADRRELLADATRCAAATSASDSHRVLAAAWALMIADNLCDERAATAVMRAVAPAIAQAGIDDGAAACLHMVYHTAFGNPQKGLDAAHRLTDSQLAAPDGGNKAKYLAHAAAALRLCGAPILEARHAAAAALEIAQRLGLAAYAAPAANQITLTFLAEGDMATARAWFEKALWLMEHSADTVGRSTILSNGAEIALRERRLGDAERLITESEQAVGHARSPRSDIRHVSFRWRLGLLRGDADPTEHDLTHFAHLHRRTRKANGQDFATAALVDLLLLRGRRREAARLLGAYVTRFRRPTAALEPDLERLRGELGVG
ncbi:MAG TPA: AAA family ATPase [Gemmatimonadaceae bacterium]|nr:AAA family ATPase [Gemmatimonadaceae bacterium]